MSYIEVKNATIRYDNDLSEPFLALSDVSLNIERGEFICLLGASGCGKTTLLNAMAGFEKVTSGSITIDGEAVTKPCISRITIFQNYGLLPWRTVESNVALGLEVLQVPETERKARIAAALESVGLGKFAKHRPNQLSGGMKQRVAIARALVVNPDIIFMDEPFGALDAITRMKLQEDVRSLCVREKKTIIFVTHDIEEAVYLADRIVVLTPNPGRLKGVINISMPQTERDRTSADFIKAREKVFDIFNKKSLNAIEYFI
ncbi:MAG: ABC transporter ATP-binding protein [Bacteroidales bacterium]|nr:ABC transporter ATP-binding protein [Bacteroidales bacterium]